MKLFTFIILPFLLALLLFSCLTGKLEKYGSFICRGELRDTKTDADCRRICGFKKSYVIRNKTDCMRAKYGCEKGQARFGDHWGCGCMIPVPCRETELNSGAD